ncbi:MAG: phospho-N-acetylmuramoyl-pentapeptide-transferase [Deltaproteobacteria bacterium]|nr:phospho-N-acetylmuramoyl-pentapeptide-transferase [Deltaproteobacteria bacterium]
MLYHLLYPLHVDLSYFRVFKYTSFRVFMAILTALFIGLVFGRPIIRFLKKKQGQANNVREDVPDSHLAKSGTPTMGGILILITMTVSFLLWARLDLYITWIALLTAVGFALIGLIDDLSKIRKKGGLSALGKLSLQVGFSFLIGFLFMYLGFDTSLVVPFFKNLVIPLGLLFVPFVALVLVASSNAVNLTDGLDGLAIGPIIVSSITYLLFAYLAGNVNFSEYLQIPYIQGASELCILCGALFGSALSFLWYNTYPAQVFMGDIGSLSLGGTLGVIAIMVKQELLLILVGGVFVLEASSVIIQVLSFRLTGKRVFRMAPIHHHFELKGWAEPKVIVRFWIISIILAILSLATLKLR